MTAALSRSMQKRSVSTVIGLAINLGGVAALIAQLH